MLSEHRLKWLSLMALFLASTGCCCVQGVPGNCGPCGMSGLASCGGCAGGCGEAYVDEWVSNPPCPDACCSGDCRPVRSLLRALWGSRFVNGCDMCGGCDSCGGCDGGCDGGCGYASAGGSGCTSCGGGHGGGCASCGGGAVATEPIMHGAARRMPAQHQQYVQEDSEPRMVPGSYKVSAPRRLNANVASERINPARQKIEAKRASYAN